jgi:hypothetical protein
VGADRRLTVREVGGELGISLGSCQIVLTKDLGMRCVSEKSVPWLLTAEQKEHHLFVASGLLEYVGAD